MLMMTSRAITQQRCDWAAGALLRRRSSKRETDKFGKNCDDVLDAAARTLGGTR
jgi:hypothetical protein